MPRPRRDKQAEDLAARRLYNKDRKNRPLYPVKPPRSGWVGRTWVGTGAGRTEEQEWAARSGRVRVRKRPVQ